MKKTVLPAVLAIVASSSFVQADIHMPPAADQGPTRKLGRGFSNLVFGVTELPYQVATTNEKNGNAAASGYGVARGVGRTFFRLGQGVQEILLFPFPLNKGKYTAPYRSDTLWDTAGYSEFTPELGWDSRFPWGR